MLRRLHQKRSQHDGVQRRVLEAEIARLVGARRIAVADQREVEADLGSGLSAAIFAEGSMVLAFGQNRPKRMERCPLRGLRDVVVEAVSSMCLS
jgi:hypothetical protein